MVFKVDDYLFPPDEIIDEGLLTKSDYTKLKLKGVEYDLFDTNNNLQLFKDVVCRFRGHIFGYISAKGKFAFCTTCRRLIKVKVLWNPGKDRDAQETIDRYNVTRKTRRAKARIHLHSS